MGGLGNQMFQYAFGRRMALINNTELVLDDSLLLDRSQPNELVTHRNFDLDVFNLKPYRWASEKEVFLYNGSSGAFILKKIFRKLKNLVSPKTLIIQNANEVNLNYLKFNSDVCFVGRWQSELYFKDITQQLREEFVIKAPVNSEIVKYNEIISNCNAVCLHIRRGDLVSSAIYSNTIGALEWSYYECALSYLKERVENPVFFIFSDDIDWCQKNIQLNEKTYYMNEETSGIKASGHLLLMTKCKHFIIANSTFAWWGAWLANSENKIVVYPKNWYKDVKNKNPQMCPINWKAL